jgi:hypothetical protein
MSARLIDAIFALSTQVRYVAVYRDQELVLRARPGLTGASAAESDRYEELLVNPTLLTLAGQRGAIDCGGLEFLVIRYGNFFQVVRPVSGGHLSVAVEPDADPLVINAKIGQLLPSLLDSGAP